MVPVKMSIHIPKKLKKNYKLSNVFTKTNSRNNMNALKYHADLKMAKSHNCSQEDACIYTTKHISKVPIY